MRARIVAPIATCLFDSRYPGSEMTMIRNTLWH